MTHLNNHPHSFVKNNIVISTLVFNSHDHDLIEIIRQAQEADWVQCNCDYKRFITPGAIWNGIDFTYENGTIIPREYIIENEDSSLYNSTE